MQLLDAQVLTKVNGNQLFVRIEANDRTQAFLFALGVQYHLINPSEDSGRAWYEFQCTPQMVDALKDLVDFIGTVVYASPTFGQLLLLEDDHAPPL